MGLVRSMMPVSVAVEPQKEEPIETLDDLKKGLESIGVRFEDLQPFKTITTEADADWVRERQAASQPGNTQVTALPALSTGSIAMKG
jgi:hypothetical protein